MGSVETTLEDEDNGIGSETSKAVKAIVNYRFRNIFKAGNSDIYLASFYIDPRYPNNEILLKPNPFSETIITLSSQKHKHSSSYLSFQPDPAETAAYKRAGNYLLILMKDEKQCSPMHPKLTELVKQSKSGISHDLKMQFAAFARGDFPFQMPVLKSQTALEWWRTLETHSLASALAFIAIKIFSICPSSIADERTMSTITWLNDPLRSRQKVSTLVDMIQVRQFIRRGKQTSRELTKPILQWSRLPAKVRASGSTPSGLSEDSNVDEVEDSAERIEWLDDESDEIEIGEEGVHVQDEVNLKSETLRRLLADEEELERDRQQHGEDTDEGQNSIDILDESWEL
ncbi:hypothetical protein M422DRAFT_262154 [Sphaerobolus stellatus SS14]|uniref:HAT C-terminal dimerisation domain-containing protein n=1 Tax=Sphaerobolus stellatus (strain SS14) TaxID=990650 RepID=A0A0C9V1K8_SPHS4|nr:hypothetical protein M422DRAFT_262154 [Sphaerobolus stellatus SS14]